APRRDGARWRAAPHRPAGTTREPRERAIARGDHRSCACGGTRRPFCLRTRVRGRAPGGREPAVAPAPAAAAGGLEEGVARRRHGPAVGMAGVVLIGKRAPALDPRRVVVAGFEDLSGDPTLAPLGHIAADWLTQALARRGGLEVVPGTATGHLDAADIRALALQTGAGTVVSGSYYREGDSVRFQVQIIDAARGTVRRGVEPVGAPRLAP